MTYSIGDWFRWQDCYYIITNYDSDEDIYSYCTAHNDRHIGLMYGEAMRNRDDYYPVSDEEKLKVMLES